MCTGNQVAGIILCSGTLEMKKFGRVDIPVITMERFRDNGTASVECDNRQGGELAAEKLISCGCRNLLQVGNIANQPMPADTRAEGFRAVCERENVSFVEVSVQEAQYYNMRYSEILEDALRKYAQTDGIFASSDVIAAQALQACRKLRISVPDQMKIIGFDDMQIATITTPQLTTIHQPVKEMAEIAISLLHDAVQEKLVPRRTVLPVHLVERETT